MVIKDKLFPSQEKTEKVFLLIRKHWFIYITFALIAILMLIPVAIAVPYLLFNQAAFSNLQLGEFAAGVSTYLLFTIGVFIYGFVNYYLGVYIVTDKRIVEISQNGFFSRNISEFHLRQVQDVSAHVKGIFKTFFHFGDVYIQTAGKQENFIFIDVPHPYTVAKEIIELHEYLIERETSRTKRLLPTLVSLEADEPEKGIWLERIEEEAKEILKATPIAKKIKAGGLFPAKQIQKRFELDTGHKLYHAHECRDDDNSKTEGELCEGKEIKLN